MKTFAYYNEIDTYAAQWLRNLIEAGHIPPGVVDERSIKDVVGSDLSGFSQCHFFAGIGVWAHALRRAGWADDRQVWTGSCPCQPFSVAGKGAGFDDERHLWPEWIRLIRECGPRVVFGEQVASKDGLAWLDAVHADLEGAGYAVGAFDLCAAGVGAPHIRQRLYFAADRVGDASGSRLEGCIRVGGIPRGACGDDQGQAAERTGIHACRLADDDSERLVQQHVLLRKEILGWATRDIPQAARSGGSSERRGERADRSDGGTLQGAFGAGPTNGLWRDADWLFCRDGFWRPVKSGSFPLADGAPARVGRLRAYGNAIVAPLAEEFIRSYLDVRHEYHNDVIVNHEHAGAE